MKLTYNSFPLHDLGDLSISHQREYEGGDPPQRAKVTLRIKLDTFAPTHTDNFQLLTDLSTALREQYAVLRWEDEDTGKVWIDGSACLMSADLPEDPNGWGTFQGQINLSFYYYEHNLNPNNQPARFTVAALPGPPVVPEATFTFHNITKWSEGINNERFDPLRPHRERTIGKLSASGLILPDDGDTLAIRRTKLQALKTQLVEEMASAEGVFTFGDFNQTIKIEEFTAEIDQSTWSIAWSFSASYVKFPGTEYHTARYTLDTRDGFTGEIFLTFAGKIAANSEAVARARLATIRTAILAQTYAATDFTTAQPLRQESSADAISANADGDTFTEITFSEEYRAWRSDNLRLTYLSSGATIPLDIGEVLLSAERYSARRFNDLHSERQHAAGQLALSGVWKSDPTQTIADRRAALFSQHAAMLAAVNTKDGILKWHGVDYAVRIEDFSAQINQAIYAVEWSMTAIYTKFPDEANYAIAEYTVSTKDEQESGDQNFTFTGRIASQTAAAANTKLDALRTAVLATAGYAVNQQLRAEQTPASVDSPDGSAFIELSFTEEYRRRKTDILSWTLRQNRKEDVKTGFAMVNYAGTVTASGASADAAYSAALDKAADLGANKLTFAIGSTITHDRRQVQGTHASPIEFVKLEFSYDYQDRIRAGNTFFEINSETALETFGTDTETVSGQVTAATIEEASAVYRSQIRASFSTRLILNERTNSHREGRQSGSGYILQEIRLDYSFSVHKPKATATNAIKYSLQSTRNYLQLELRTTISGSVYSDTRANADTFLAGILTGLGLTNVVESTRTEDRDNDSRDFFLKLDFTEVYSQNLTGDNAIMENDITQEIEYSGTRWVSQPIPRATAGGGGISIMQDCGQKDGHRVIRGSVTSASFSAAMTWVRKQKQLLTGDKTSGTYTGSIFTEPERVEVAYVFPPHAEGFRGNADGCSADGTSNVRAYKISFTFAEILPNYPMPTSGIKA